MWALTLNKGRSCCPRWGSSGGREMSGDRQLIRRGAFCWQLSSSSYFWWDSHHPREILLYHPREILSCHPREILLQFFFRKENHPLPAPHLNLREYSRCDSPFTLAFDKYSAIPLHFPKKKWHSHILTPPLTTALQYELISQIGKVLPNFLFSHHHFVQNGKLQSFNFNLMWGRWWQPFYQNDKSEKWKRAKMFAIDL